MSDLNARIVLSVDGAQESGKSIGQVADAVQHLGRELGGELGAKAEAAAQKMRALSEQQRALQNVCAVAH